MSSRDRRALRNRQIGTWVKWVAIVLSVTLLAATLWLVCARRSAVSGTDLPTSVGLQQPVIAR